jgi:type I restriction enzyme S subunit
VETSLWEQRKLGDIASFINGRAYKQKELLDHGKYKVLRVGNFYTNSEWYYSNLELADKFYAHTGDLLYTWSATFGPHIWTGEKVIYHYHIWKILLSKDLNRDFAVQLLKRDQEQIMVGLNGSTMIHITKSGMEKKQVRIPAIREQKFIADFFNELDKTIALHQRQLNQLQTLKREFLKRLFPQREQQQPQLRFTGFDDAWEQRKLGDIADISRGASPRPIQDSKWFDDESDIGWLRISDVTEQNGRIHHLEQHISILGQKKTRVLTSPHLLLSIAATVGKPVINYVKTGVHDGFLIFYNLRANQEFLYQWLEMYRPLWQKYGQPGSQVNLNSELVKNQIVMLPEIDEQARIVAFLTGIDHTIALHQKKAACLKALKASFLQKLFV